MPLPDGVPAGSEPEDFYTWAASGGGGGRSGVLEVEPVGAGPYTLDCTDETVAVFHVVAGLVDGESWEITPPAEMGSPFLVLLSAGVGISGTVSVDGGSVSGGNLDPGELLSAWWVFPYIGEGPIWYALRVPIPGEPSFTSGWAVQTSVESRLSHDGTVWVNFIGDLDFDMSPVYPDVLPAAHAPTAAIMVYVRVISDAGGDDVHGIAALAIGTDGSITVASFQGFDGTTTPTGVIGVLEQFVFMRIQP